MLGNCGPAFLGEFETTRSVFELSQVGALQIHPPRATGSEAIVELFNGAMRLAYEAASRAGRLHELQAQLDGFTESTVLYGVLFGGAGPRDDGAFDADRVVKNLERTHAVDGASLAQWLYEYAAFALFVVRQAIPASEEQALASAVGQRLARLSGK